MKKLFSIVIIFMSFIILISCNDDEKIYKGQLIILSNAGSPTSVRFSTFDYLSKTLNENVFTLSSPANPVVITGAAAKGDNLYALISDRKPGLDKIELINSLTWTHSKSADLNLVADSARITILNDNVLVAGFGGDGKTYLHVFDHESLTIKDKILLRENAEIKGILGHDSKIYISYVGSSGPRILVLDCTTYEELKDIESPYSATILKADPNGYVLAFHKMGFVKINGSTLNATLLDMKWKAKTHEGLAGQSFGFDRNNNTVYYASEVGPGPIVNSINLTDLTFLGIWSNFAWGENFVEFDNGNNLLVTSHLNVIQLYNKSYYDEFMTEDIPWGIVINTSDTHSYTTKGR